MNKDEKSFSLFRFPTPFKKLKKLKATLTGKRRELINRSTRKTCKYEIKVEWEFLDNTVPAQPVDLYVSSTPGALANGTIVVCDVLPYYWGVLRILLTVVIYIIAIINILIGNSPEHGIIRLNMRGMKFM